MGVAWRNFWWLFRRSFVLAYNNNCFGTAKGAAYSALLSFFPLMTATATILVQIRAEPVSRILSRALSEAVPPGTEQLVLNHFRVHGERPKELLVIATLLSVWAASRVMTSLMEGFQASYHIPVERSFLRRQGMAILLVFSAAIPALIASTLIVLGARTERAVMGWLGLVRVGVDLQDWIPAVFMLLRYAVALGTIIWVNAALYHLGPNRPQQWRYVWPGAVLATVLWLLATLGFTSYVRNIADYNVLYGSIGAVIALLVWMYLLAAIALIGCQFNAEYERMKLMENEV